MKRKLTAGTSLEWKEDWLKGLPLYNEKKTNRRDFSYRTKRRLTEGTSPIKWKEDGLKGLPPQSKNKTDRRDLSHRVKRRLTEQTPLILQNMYWALLPPPSGTWWLGRWGRVSITHSAELCGLSTGEPASLVPAKSWFVEEREMQLRSRDIRPLSLRLWGMLAALFLSANRDFYKFLFYISVIY